MTEELDYRTQLSDLVALAVSTFGEGATVSLQKVPSPTDLTPRWSALLHIPREDGDSSTYSQFFAMRRTPGDALRSVHVFVRFMSVLEDALHRRERL